MKIKHLVLGIFISIMMSGCLGSGDGSNDSSGCEYTTITVTSTSVNSTVKTELEDSGICNEITLTNGSATITLDGKTQDMTINKVYTVDVK